MTAKEYLSQALLTERRIKELREEIQRLRELACSVSGGTGEHVGTEGAGDRVGQNAAQIVYLEEMLGAEINLYSQLYMEITDVISKVSDARYAEVLRRRYIMGNKFCEIADSMNYSTQNIWRLHKKAIREISEIISQP